MALTSTACSLRRLDAHGARSVHTHGKLYRRFPANSLHAAPYSAAPTLPAPAKQPRDDKVPTAAAPPHRHCERERRNLGLTKYPPLPLRFTRLRRRVAPRNDEGISGGRGARHREAAAAAMAILGRRSA